MSGPSSRRHLGSRFLRHRLGQLIPLLLLAAVLGLAVAGSATVRASATRAIDDSIRWEFADRSYALQTADARVVDLLDGRGSPVADDDGELTTDAVASPVSVRITDDPALALGLLTEGRRPASPGEALLNRGLADVLGVAVGDVATLTLDGEELAVTVVGLSSDPAQADSRALSVLRTSEEMPATTRWLFATDPYTEPALQAPLDARAATYQSLKSLLEAGRAQQPPFLGALRFVPLSLAVLLGGVLLAVTSVLARAWSRDVDGLVAAGMPRRTAIGRLCAAVGAATVLATLLGAGLAVGGLWLTRDTVSGWFGQDWVAVRPPWVAVVAPAATLGVVAALVPSVARAGGVLRRRLTPRARTGIPRGWARLGLLVGAGALAALVLLVLLPSPTGDEGVTTTLPLVALLVAATLPLLLAPVARLGLGAAARRMMEHLGHGLTVVTIAAALVVVATGAWSAITTYGANSGEAESSPYVPAGSFVISDLPDSAIPDVRARYQEHGGGEVVSFRHTADTGPLSLRVTSPTLGACAGRDPGAPLEMVEESCWPQRTAAPVNTVMVGTEGSSAVADPGLVEDGSLALLGLTAQGSVESVATVSATPDARLGGNLPGLVVPPDSPLLQPGSLEVTDRSLVMLPDFHGLDPQDRFELRAELLRLAPGAQFADGTDPTAYDRQRSMATLFSFLGAGAAALTVGVGGTALVAGHRVTRRTLADLATRNDTRLLLALRWIAVPVLTFTAAAVLIYLAASVGGRATDYSYGWLWTLPALAALAACAVVAGAFLRVPPPLGD